MAEDSNAAKKIDLDQLEADFRADPGNFVPLARAYLERHLPLQAIEVCKKGLKHNPNAPQGLLALGMAYYHAYDDVRAESVLRKVTQVNPEAAAAFRALGEIYLERGQEEKALQELNRALEIEPRETDARRLLESLGQKLPNLRSANGRPLDMWPARLHPAPADVGKPISRLLLQVAVVAAVMALIIVWYRHHVQVRTQIENYLQEAAKVIPQDNYHDLLAAEEQLLKAYQLDDSNINTVVRLAVVQSQLWLEHGLADRKAGVEKLSAWMEKKNLPNPERFSTQALLMISAGKVAEAEKYLNGIIERAIEKKDIFLDSSIFGVRALAIQRQGKLKEAREDYSRASRFTAESPRYFAQLADLYLREGELERAARHFGDALRIKPSHHFSNLRQAYSFVLSEKNLDRAEKILEEYFDPQRHPEDSFSAPLDSLRYLVRAEFLLLKNDLAGAQQWVNKALAAYDANAEAHALAGRLAALNKDGARARAEFARALELDPYLPKIYFDRSEALFAMGDKADAVAKLKDFEKYLQPTVAYYVNLGMLYLRQDDTQSALAQFEKAVKLDELDPSARYHMGLGYKVMAEKLGTGKEVTERKRELYNTARTWFEETLMLPGGEKPEVYHQMGRIYLDSEDTDNALDTLGKAALMMFKAGEPSYKIAEVYDDIARVFAFMGGTEGEKQKKIFEMKARGLREGKTMEQVEKEAAEEQKALGKQRRGRKKG
jgi:tetratricopeptide (TPR) repeat protein